MSEEAAPALADEARHAAWGLLALLRHDLEWSRGFDASARGFARSFLAQALALPFYLLTAAMVARAAEEGASSAPVVAAGLSHILDALAFPTLIAVIARPLGMAAGYSAFIVVINWASLVLNVLLALASLAVFGGEEGLAVFQTFAIFLFGTSLFLTWRAATETMTHEIAPAVLLVVLSVGVGVLCDQGASLALRGLG